MDHRQPQTLAACPHRPAHRILFATATKSRKRLYGSSVRKAAEARREADKLACEEWTKPMLAFRGPAQPSPTLGDALNAGYSYLEVRSLGCDTHQTVAFDLSLILEAVFLTGSSRSRHGVSRKTTGTALPLFFTLSIPVFTAGVSLSRLVNP